MMQSNLKVAITGGIGSGKSTVAGIIKELGYEVFSCDDIYKSLLKEKQFVTRLAEKFGSEIIMRDGALDRRKLSSIVFGNKKQLKKLNDLTHPEIMKQALNKMRGKAISFCEVPLLFESCSENYFDKIIVVLRDRTKRISAIAERDGLSSDAVESRINSQIDYDNMVFEKYYVIHNNSNVSELRNSVVKLLEEIK